MSRHEDCGGAEAGTRTLAAIAAQVASGFLHHLAPSFRPPARLVCPSDEAEQAVIDAVTQAAAARGIPVDVIDLRPAPTERLDAVTARLDEWRSGAANNDADAMPTLLILRGFDVFGDDAHDAPTYPFRSEFQFDQKFLLLNANQLGSDRQTFWAAAPNELDTAASLLGTMRLLGRGRLALAHRVAFQFQLMATVDQAI